MSLRNINFSSEWFKLARIFIISILIGVVLFFINNLTGFLSAFIIFIQLFLGLIFGVWYLRLMMVYFKEMRKKEPEKKVGVNLAWAIYGLITAFINFCVWIFLSNLAFNFPKIIFFVPTVLASVQILHIFIKTKRRKIRDWLLLVYNVFVFLYLFVWTLIDFGVDLPSVLGILGHTVTSDFMWWQILFLNTGAFFSPTFIFPPYMLNPRYYFAMNVDDYFAMKEESEEATEDEQIVVQEEESKKSIEEIQDKSERLPGDRIPFFEERVKQRKMVEELAALKRDQAMQKKDRDTLFAEYIGSNDVSFSYRKFVSRYDSFIRILSLSVILILIVITPITFSGNISMNVLPKYNKLEYTTNPNMVIGVCGSVFSSPDYNGNFTIDWEEELNKEILWANELKATHIRYDLKNRVINNTLSKQILDVGLPSVESQGLDLIIGVLGDIAFSKQEYLNMVYLDAITIATDYQPDYMIIFNDINGELMNNLNLYVTIEGWLNAIANISSVVKSISPSTKIVTTVHATKDYLESFPKLFNSSLNLDVIGVNFFPAFFGWRYSILQQYSDLFYQYQTSEKFWLSETGMESFNFGEDAQGKYLAKVMSDVSNEDKLNADGICIKSLIDNEGFSIERGITSHFGLIYFNGKKKVSFDAVAYAIGEILGL
ncbi:MAG: hypothetical protein ACFFDW_03755 [Candidatus Thorarchaeota archaeon]